MKDYILVKEFTDDNGGTPVCSISEVTTLRKDVEAITENIEQIIEDKGLTSLEMGTFSISEQDFLDLVEKGRLEEYAVVHENPIMHITTEDGEVDNIDYSFTEKSLEREDLFNALSSQDSHKIISHISAECLFADEVKDYIESIPFEEIRDSIELSDDSLNNLKREAILRNIQDNWINGQTKDTIDMIFKHKISRDEVHGFFEEMSSDTKQKEISQIVSLVLNKKDEVIESLEKKQTNKNTSPRA